MLTRDEIENLPAGPKMDGLVAENVAGYCREHGLKSGFLIHNNEPIWCRGDGRAPITCPRYSADIGTAWQVLKLMNFELYEVRERFFEALDDLATGYGEAKHWPGALMYLKPTDICQAALIAKLPAAPSIERETHE